MPAEAQVLGKGSITLNPAKKYIYAILEDGRTIISPEEVTGGIAKHTDLTGMGRARLAGELNYRNGKWVMDNNSGRYGFGKINPTTRIAPALNSASEMNAAGSIFRANGLDVLIEYINGGQF